MVFGMKGGGHPFYKIQVKSGLLAAYVYGDFGETLERSGPMADVFPHRFSTKYHDGETGLCYYGYRFYNPALKRWMNRDPIGEEGGLNLYGFCGNQPLLSFDTLGMTAVTISMYTELRPDLKSNLKKLFLMISATITEPPPLGNMINFIQLKTTDGVNWSLDACKDAEPYYIETYDLINRTSENENKQKIVTMGDAPCGAISDIVDFFVAVVEIQRSCKPSQIKFLQSRYDKVTVLDTRKWRYDTVNPDQPYIFDNQSAGKGEVLPILKQLIEKKKWNVRWSYSTTVTEVN